VVFAVLFGFSCIHLRNFCAVDSATHMNVSRSVLMECAPPHPAGVPTVSYWSCVSVHMCWRIHKQWQKQEDPTHSTKRTYNNDKERILWEKTTELSIQFTFPFPSVALFSPMVFAQFLAGLLCKSYAKISKTMSSDSSLVTKNSMEPCLHILMHKAFPHHGQKTSADGEVTIYHLLLCPVGSWEQLFLGIRAAV